MIPAFKTFSIVTPIAVAGLALAACGEQATPAPETPATTDTAVAPAAAPAAAGTTLGKVDLNQPIRLLGNEPNWMIDITPASISIKPNLDAAQQVAENKGPTVQGETATWTTQTSAGVPVQITTTLKDCSDTMSDRVYSLTATAKVGNETMNGCAASLKAIETVGESGRLD